MKDYLIFSGTETFAFCLLQSMQLGEAHMIKKNIHFDRIKGRHQLLVFKVFLVNNHECLRNCVLLCLSRSTLFLSCFPVKDAKGEGKGG